MWTDRLPLTGAVCLLLGVVLAQLPATPAKAATRSDLQAARISLEAARDALSAATAEFRTQQSRGGLARSDAADFLAYLGRLKRSVLSNCRTVQELKQQLGDASPEPGCDTQEMRPAGPVSFPAEQTEEERVAGLDRRLGASMSEFDELLLREMDELQRKRSGSPDSSGGSGTGGGGGGQGEAAGNDGESRDGTGEGDQAREQAGRGQPDGESEQQPEGRPQAEGSASQAGRSGDQGGAHGGGRPGGEDASQTASRDAPPADDDDDIVARQLREAAEKETDPVLREKLWEEYRRYKQKQASQSQSKNLN